MNNYYFTFGKDHYLFNGIPMHERWVRVVAENFEKARSIFIQRFTTHYMSKPDMFSWQYEQHNFKSEFFPSGEYMLINQKD